MLFALNKVVFTGTKTKLQCVPVDGGRSDSKYVEAYYGRGIARAFLGDKENAINDFTTTLTLNPQHKDSYYNRGVQLLRKGEYKSAIDDFSKAIEIDPNYASAYANRGSVYYGLNELTKSLEDLNKALTIAPVGWNVRTMVEQWIVQVKQKLQNH